MNAAIGQYFETCHVVAKGCLAPANGVLGEAKSKCFACGLTVCTNCSSRREYLGYGRQRICDDCQEQHFPNGGTQVRRRHERRNK